MKVSQRVTARVSIVGAVVASGLLALSAALAFATAGGDGGFAAKQRILAVRCPVGQAAEAGGECSPLGAPEGPIESFALAAERTARQSAPFQTVAPGAQANALGQRSKKAKSAGTWAPVGATPLHADSPDYTGIDPVLTAGPSRLGWSNLSGRITALANDPGNANRIFAAPARGGLWESTDGGQSWRSIGGSLPSQSMGGVAYSVANGGTIIAGTGDNAVGGVVTPSGLGVYTSRNDGSVWTKSTGVPDGTASRTRTSSCRPVAPT